MLTQLSREPVPNVLVAYCKLCKTLVSELPSN